MTFPDQSHINIVRDALHQRTGNGASVMVGSGFSRNADRILRGAKEMPMWQDLGNHFYDALYPPASGSVGGTEHGPAHNNVRIAQEYEAAFGRSALHDALRRLVPDTEFGPGPLHLRLLSLPWRDIYTTNWDTLLERAKSQINEQSYSPVTNVEEIPMAKRPRIVKLHGSFPAQFPLIVTEEDYRTYPTGFAPFVNTVQQSMMETVFLLIGFSGDDPNFLNWSGWVRDNLGTSAPKIYLAGWLGLSTHRRRMLENHNVVPIDLAQHPKGQQWPENLRNTYATDWLLRSLEQGRPYDITSWPAQSNRQPDEAPEHLRPTETANLGEPRLEAAPPSGEAGPSPEGILDITSIWRYNRLMYPGWVTMPPFNRWTMDQNTSAWKNHALTALPRIEPVQRLRFLRELAWREEILLVPMTPGFESAITSALESIDCHHRTIDGAAAPSENWTVIRENWRNAAAALVTSARFRFDQEGFEHAIEALAPFLGEDTDLFHRVSHEKCLWAVYDRDFELLDELVEHWKPENCDPIWMTRKSAMMWEAGRYSEATELLNNSLTAMQAMPTDDTSLASLSRESWATFAALDFANRLPLLDRLRELVPMRCDPFEERTRVIENMNRNQEEEDPSPFDLNRRRGTSLRIVNYDPNAAAYRAVRLPEMAGLPPVTEHSTIWAEVMRKAAEEIADYNLQLAVRLVLRASGAENDKTLERVVTRTRVAIMTTELVEALVQSCMNALKKALRDKVAPRSTMQRRFTTAAEVLSRLAIRLEPDQAEYILDRAVGFCQDADLAKSFVDTSIRNLLTRSWEALPEERRQHRAMDLLSTDLVAISHIAPIVGLSWPDPAEVVAITDTIPLRTPENEPQWQAAIDLIIRGLSGDPTARRRASHRLVPLVRSNSLCKRESEQVAKALWSEEHTASNGLPGGTDLFDWSFLTFPEHPPGIGEHRFRSKWLSHDENGSYEIQRKVRGVQIRLGSDGLNHDPQDVESRLRQVGAAIRSLQRIDRTLELSQTDQKHLTQLLNLWSEDPVEQPDHPMWDAIAGDSIQQLTIRVTEVLPAIMGEINVSQTLAGKIHAKMRELNTSRLPACGLAAGLVKTNPELAPEIATELRVGITSDHQQLARNALSGLLRWLEEASNPESEIPQPPDDLVKEVGIAIASGRNTVITTALELATWIFDTGQDSHREAIQTLTEDGLRFLSRELRYDREHENPDEIPLKRLYCVELAAAMAKRGLSGSPAVAQWLEAAKEDPLPEVRQAIAKHDLN